MAGGDDDNNVVEEIVGGGVLLRRTLVERNKSEDALQLVVCANQTKTRVGKMLMMFSCIGVDDDENGDTRNWSSTLSTNLVTVYVLII